MVAFSTRVSFAAGVGLARGAGLIGRISPGLGGWELNASGVDDGAGVALVTGTGVVNGLGSTEGVALASETAGA
jgi:hypothetical protein